MKFFAETEIGNAFGRKLYLEDKEYPKVSLTDDEMLMVRLLRSEGWHIVTWVDVPSMDCKMSIWEKNQTKVSW